MPRCSFCGKDYSLNKGVTFVKTDGTILHFCSSKCRKNFNLGRDKKKVKWIKKMKVSRKEMIEEIKKEAEEHAEEQKTKKEIMKEAESEKSDETEKKEKNK